MKEILVTECRSCPFESDDGEGGSYCRIDNDYNGYTSGGGTPEWCPLFNEDVFVRRGDIDESEFRIN